MARSSNSGLRPTAAVNAAAYVSRRALSRRTLLRGMSASIALPWLDAMCPSFSDPKAPPVRTGFIFMPNGLHSPHWKPTTLNWDRGAPSDYLGLLAEHRDQFIVPTRLCNEPARKLEGEGRGPHARAVGGFLTCAHAKETWGRALRTGISADQVIAANVGGETRFRSLEVGTERQLVKEGEYSTVYYNSISWKSPTRPATPDIDPLSLYRRLFGRRESPAATGERLVRRRSILDEILSDARGLRATLNGGDQSKLDEYLDSIRELEGQLSSLAPMRDIELPDGLEEQAAEAEDHFPTQLRVMYRLIALAFQSDATRIATFMTSAGMSLRVYRSLGITRPHHPTSHHAGDESKIADIVKIDRFHLTEFSRFLSTLKGIREGDGTLLDASQILFASAIGDGNNHKLLNLITLLAGTAGGQWKAGQILECEPRTPVANLYLRMMHSAGVPAESFANSSEPLPLPSE